MSDETYYVIWRMHGEQFWCVEECGTREAANNTVKEVVLHCDRIGARFSDRPIISKEVD